MALETRALRVLIKRLSLTPSHDWINIRRRSPTPEGKRNNVKDDPKSDHSGESPVCSWCGRRFQPGQDEHGLICEKCVRLLKNAGLPDKEIFAPPEEKVAHP